MHRRALRPFDFHSAGGGVYVAEERLKAGFRWQSIDFVDALKRASARFLCAVIRQPSRRPPTTEMMGPYMDDFIF